MLAGLMRFCTGRAGSRALRCSQSALDAARFQHETWQRPHQRALRRGTARILRAALGRIVTLAARGAPLRVRAVVPDGRFVQDVAVGP
jgi:hypothetical protein